jgi:hypothetical protein
MSGAWEVRDQKKILLHILHTDLCTIAFALGLRKLILPGQILPVTGMPYDHGRNSAVRACLDNGFEYLAGLDSDIIPPPDAFLRLLARNQPFISGLYHRRSPPHGVPVAIKNGQWVTQFQPGSVFEVDTVGAGLLLIHRSVLEKTLQAGGQRPLQGKVWFDWKVDCRGLCGPDGKPVHREDECLSEDFSYCRWVKRVLGVKVMLDTSVVAKHVGLAEAGYGSFKPLETVA